MFKYKNVFLIILINFSLYACQSLPEPDSLNPEQIMLLQQRGFQFNSDDDEWVFGLATKMLFEFNSDIIQEDQRQSVKDIISDLLKVGIERIRLDGHTDNIGNPEYNLELSIRRAKSVAKLAIEAGMREENVTVRGYGDTRPVENNSTEDGRSENRRVALIVSNY